MIIPIVMYNHINIISTKTTFWVYKCYEWAWICPDVSYNAYLFNLLTAIGKSCLQDMLFLFCFTVDRKIVSFFNFLSLHTLQEFAARIWFWNEMSLYRLAWGCVFKMSFFVAANQEHTPLNCWITFQSSDSNILIPNI